jgi:predicted MFS family arabinose efflux permease
VFQNDPLEPLHYQVLLETARQKRADHVRHLLCSLNDVCGNAPPGLLVIPLVFLPLAGGYLLSYVFRTINGSIADELVHEFSLDAGSLGLLTSVYFLAFAASAIPIGVALDAFGPRLVQGCLMSIAAVGSAVFALASGPFALVAGRTLIGLGVAGGLMAGLKAHALWVPPRYLPLANGGLMMFGGLGAIVATLPVGAIDDSIGWRGTFLLLAAASLAASVFVFALVPRRPASEGRLRSRAALQGFIGAVTDRRFLRVAPLSASVVGTSFAVHGLWAAQWLRDVDGFGAKDVLDGLLAMGAGLTLGSLAIGAAAVGLAKLQISYTNAFGWLCAASIGLQAAVLLHLPLSQFVLWGAVGAFGCMGVLSYSILDSMFPAALVGRANSALNVLHLTAAWAVQAGMGAVIAMWPAGPHHHYSVLAYRAAFAMPLAVQIAALAWFVLVPLTLRPTAIGSNTARVELEPK